VTDGAINPHDLRLYRRLVGLSVKQLAAIKARLSGDTGRWGDLLFRHRNGRMKQTLLDILDNKQHRLAEDGVAELLDDLKRIEADAGAWRAVGKEELDYVQIVLHGLRAVTADTNGLLDDSA